MLLLQFAPSEQISKIAHITSSREKGGTDSTICAVESERPLVRVEVRDVAEG